MVGTLVRLKVALIRGGLQGSGLGAVVAFIAALMISLGFGGLAAAGLASLRLVRPDVAADVTAGAFCALFIGWVLAPLVTLASDNTLEPDRLSLFPLRAGELMPGLVVASVVGFGGMFSVAVVGGSVIGLTRSVQATTFVVVAAATELLLCVTASRAVGTALSAAARTRRWRDVALTVGPLLVLGLNLAFQLWNRRYLHNAGRSHPGQPLTYRAADFATLRRVARWLPPGWPAQAMRAAGQGRYVVALAFLAGSAGMILVAVIVWWRGIQRLTTRAPLASARVARRRPLVPRWLPANRLGAVAAKELKYLRRDPRRRAALLGALMGGLLPLVSFSVTLTSSRIVLVAAAPALALALNQANQFGFDASAHWMNVAAGDDAASDLRGKSLANALVAVVVVTLAIAGLSAVARSIAAVPSAIALAVAAWGVGSGFAVVLSVTTPFPMPERSMNVFSSGGTGTGLQAAGGTLGAMFGSAVILGPFVAAMIVIPLQSPWQVLIDAVAIAAGIGGRRLGLWRAIRYAKPRQAEILAAITTRS